MGEMIILGAQQQEWRPKDLERMFAAIDGQELRRHDHH